MAWAEANANHVENRAGFHVSGTQTLYFGSHSQTKQVIKLNPENHQVSFDSNAFI